MWRISPLPDLDINAMPWQIVPVCHIKEAQKRDSQGCYDMGLEKVEEYFFKDYRSGFLNIFFKRQF